MFALLENEAVITASIWLVTYFAHSTVLLGAVWVAAHWRPFSASTEELLWKTALLGGLLTTSVQVFAGGFPGTELTVLGDAFSVGGPGVSPAGSLASPPAAEPDGLWHLLHSDDPDVASSGGAEILPGIMIALWLGGGVLVGADHVLERIAFFSSLSPREPLQDVRLQAMLGELARRADLKRDISLTTSRHLRSPLALGADEICLPRLMRAAFSPAQQRSILAHELAHLRRGDPWWLISFTMLESLFFFQPLNYLARKRLQDLAEEQCDRHATRWTGQKKPLAEALLVVARRMQHQHGYAGIAAMASPRSRLAKRIDQLAKADDEMGPRRSWRTVALALSLLALAACVMPEVSLFPKPSSTATSATLSGAAAFSSSMRAESEPIVGLWRIEANFALVNPVADSSRKYVSYVHIEPAEAGTHAMHTYAISESKSRPSQRQCYARHAKTIEHLSDDSRHDVEHYIEYSRPNGDVFIGGVKMEEGRLNFGKLGAASYGSNSRYSRSEEPVEALRRLCQGA